MKNEKAQALIEFVLILPILIILIFSIIDFGNIFITKSDLQDKIDDAYYIAKTEVNKSDLKNDINEVINPTKNKILVELKDDEEKGYLTITLTKEIKTITPGLNLIIGYPYKVTAERVIKYEKQ